MSAYLIVGLGNPGVMYEKTRHNLGFKVVDQLAKKYKLEFKKEKKFQSKIAYGKILDYDVYLLMPLTYMNESGTAVKKVASYFKIDVKNILIIVDDADIPFEEFRIKEDSSSAGHRGLESIEKHLNTQKYARLRIGIGKKTRILKSYVLDRFNKEETKKLPQIESEAVNFIELWLEKGIREVANLANIRLKKVKKNAEETK